MKNYILIFFVEQKMIGIFSPAHSFVCGLHFDWSVHQLRKWVAIKTKYDMEDLYCGGPPYIIFCVPTNYHITLQWLAIPWELPTCRCFSGPDEELDHWWKQNVSIICLSSVRVCHTNGKLWVLYVPVLYMSALLTKGELYVSHHIIRVTNKVFLEIE